MTGQRSVPQGLGDLAPVQSCLPLSPGLRCPTLTPLSSVATGPLGLPHLAWAWVQLLGWRLQGLLHIPHGIRGWETRQPPSCLRLRVGNSVGSSLTLDPGTESVPE